MKILIFFKEEPLTGDALHKAILLDKKSDVEKILDSPDGPRVLEIPDKFGNLPLMIAVNRNNLEYGLLYSFFCNFKRALRI